MEVQAVPGLVLTDRGEQEYMVERILRKKVVRGQTLYLIKWVGWDRMYNSWEPRKNLKNCAELVEKFEGERVERQKRRAGCPSASPPSKLLTMTEGSQEKGFMSRKAEELTAMDVVDSPGMGQDDEHDLEEEEQQKADLETMGPLFRRKWRVKEYPICILGSAVHNGCLLHLVRIKENDTEDVEAVIANPFEGVNDSNVVMVLSTNFGKLFPDLLIKYYQCCFELVENGASKGEVAKKAAQALEKHSGKKLTLNLDLNAERINKVGTDVFGLPVNYSIDDEGVDAEEECDYEEVPLDSLLQAKSQ